MPFLLRTPSTSGSDPQGYIPQELITNGPRTDPAYLVFATGIQATSFILDTSCHLVSTTSGNPATVVGEGVTAVNFDVNTGATPGVCQVVDINIGTLELQCTFGSRTRGQNQFGMNSNGVTYVGVDYDRGIEPFSILVNFQ